MLFYATLRLIYQPHNPIFHEYNIGEVVAAAAGCGALAGSVLGASLYSSAWLAGGAIGAFGAAWCAAKDPGGCVGRWVGLLQRGALAQEGDEATHHSPLGLPVDRTATCFCSSRHDTTGLFPAQRRSTYEFRMCA